MLGALMELSQCVDILAKRGKLGFTLQSMANYHFFVLVMHAHNLYLTVSEMLKGNVVKILERVKVMSLTMWYISSLHYYDIILHNHS